MEDFPGMKLLTNTLVVFAATALTLTVLISSGVALSQEGNATGANPASSGASSAANPEAINDATLKQTAKAYLKVRQIMQNAQQALNNTGDDSQRQQIAVQAESQKMAAVKAEGLQPQEYNQVIHLAQLDKTFQQKFLSYVNAANSSPGAAE
jgi:murein L,D-transpeptidase YcbB/YkuD